ncbi:MAG: hypothetical protein LBD16_02450 [Oscillospiraceae bacterium]|nr:hypothetical protein [Oscillospiraceae bacterium]
MTFWEKVFFYSLPMPRKAERKKRGFSQTRAVINCISILIIAAVVFCLATGIIR